MGISNCQNVCGSNPTYSDVLTSCTLALVQIPGTLLLVTMDVGYSWTLSKELVKCVECSCYSMPGRGGAKIREIESRSGASVKVSVVWELTTPLRSGACIFQCWLRFHVMPCKDYLLRFVNPATMMIIIRKLRSLARMWIMKQPRG